LTFENVRFRYRSGDEVLRGIQLTVPAGERLALVGHNGCGKSTLARLIPRLHDPTAGAIRLDGIDLREFRRRDLRQQISMVTQETWLFDNTILSNIRYGKPDATQAEVVEAARKAHAHDFITNQLPNSYGTLVGEKGSQLSGGQRQRVSLARAILRDPEVLIMDEATSEIDRESEQLIHDSLAEFLIGRTAIIITHRLSTLDLVDRIAVMEDGQIVDVGTHDELNARCAAYRRLTASQLGHAA
jgi:ATP-binding cassette subfamily B protein/subfamily B ATP-binding cassette protein MsbA